jgi:hypothetical protein
MYLLQSLIIFAVVGSNIYGGGRLTRTSPAGSASAWPGCWKRLNTVVGGAPRRLPRPRRRQPMPAPYLQHRH